MLTLQCIYFSSHMKKIIRQFNYIPVLATFFVMGFCDVVGIATSYLKQDFGLSESLAGFIPSMVFIWFLFLSVPAALLMNRVGRKTMVQLSNLITFAGMLIPFFWYSFPACMLAFILLGSRLCLRLVFIRQGGRLCLRLVFILLGGLFFLIHT